MTEAQRNDDEHRSITDEMREEMTDLEVKMAEQLEEWIVMEQENVERIEEAKELVRERVDLPDDLEQRPPTDVRSDDSLERISSMTISYSEYLAHGRERDFNRLMTEVFAEVMFRDTEIESWEPWE